MSNHLTTWVDPRTACSGCGAKRVNVSRWARVDIQSGQVLHFCCATCYFAWAGQQSETRHTVYPRGHAIEV